jgi:tetratricopeptide (TPR) repeat protein
MNTAALYEYSGPYAVHPSAIGPYRVSQLYRRTSKISHHRLILVDSPIWEIIIAKAKNAEEEQDLQATEKYLLTALKVAEKFSIHDPRLVASLDQLGQFYSKLGKHDLASDHFYVLAKVIRSSHGRISPETGHAYARLGFAYYSMGDYSAASICFRRSLSVHLSTAGRKTLTTIRASQNLALVLQAQKKHQAAFKFLSYAKSVALELLDDEHPIVRTISAQLEIVASALK